MKQSSPIERYMTPLPWTIGRDAPLIVARDVMNAHKIRHLPVLHGNRLVGLVSQRDLQLLETFRDVDPTEVTVEEAMSQDVLVVAPDAELADVAAQMAERKCGSALIAQGEQVRGIFTTIDALRALATRSQPRRKATARASVAAPAARTRASTRWACASPPPRAATCSATRSP